MKRLALKIFDFCSSVKLAVILLVALSVVMAIGTFYEAEYGTADAQRIIYKGWFMTVLMILLIVNLACAAIDRMPWKKHHIGFVITHAGIIMLLVGSFITQKKGLDGTLALGMTETADNFMVPETELHVYQMFNGKPFALLLQKPVDFDDEPPETHPTVLKLIDDDVLTIKKYIQKSTRRIQAEPSTDPKALPALQFTLYNERVNVTEWLGLDNKIPPFYDLGPATVSFIQGPLPTPPQPRNQIVLHQDPKTEKLHYAIFSMRQAKPLAKGTVTPGEEIPTGWMNLKFKVNTYIPKANAQAVYEPAAKEVDFAQTFPAIQVQVGDNTSWFELEGPHEIKGKQSTYFVNFTRRRIDLGFGLTLKKFRMNTYGGSNLPSSYESTVNVAGSPGETVISMNEPLYHKAFTLYQSSYELNERGEPIISVFSVNYDPGRPLKYFASICICLGIIIMFYWKPRFSRVKREV
jgi:hypothetical protein